MMSTTMEMRTVTVMSLKVCVPTAAVGNVQNASLDLGVKDESLLR